MSTNLLAWPVLIPLLAGTILLLVRGATARSWLSALASALTLVVSAVVFARAAGGDVLVVQMAGWPAPYGIALVADRLAAGLLLLAGIVGLLTVLLAIFTLRVAPRPGRNAVLNRAREAFGAQSLLQFVIMGVNMSFLSGDLFNLFVSFEVMLIASYGLMLLGGELPQLREGFKYVLVNLIASLIFVLGAGYAYGLVGTLNLADMAARVAAHGPDPRLTALALVLSLVFATKAAVFPLGFWLPDAYPTPPVAFSAFFAALLTKVGVYALIRIHTLIFPTETLPGTVIAVLAVISILLAVLGTIARQRWRYALSFANVASIGNVLVAVFAAGERGLAAGLYYVAHSILVVFALFAVAAVAERIAGSGYRTPGHLSRYPWLGLAFFVPAMAIAGMPPTSGFIGKFGVVSALLAGGGAARAWAAAAVLVGGFLLLYAMVQIWREFFWGTHDAVHAVRISRGTSAVVAIAVASTVGLAVLGGPVQSQAVLAARQLSDGGAYRSAVLDAPPPPGFDPATLPDAAPATGSEAPAAGDAPADGAEGDDEPTDGGARAPGASGGPAADEPEMEGGTPP